jgi:hypothetical protein
MLERSLEGAVRLAMRFRGRNTAPPAEFDTQHPSLSVEDDAAGYRGGVRLLRYYLFERNHDAFVHDEDDERIGEGDDERRRQVDKYLSRDAAVHAVSQETVPPSAASTARRCTAGSASPSIQRCCPCSKT